MRLQKRRLIDAGFGNSATSSEGAHDPEITVNRAGAHAAEMHDRHLAIMGSRA
jgi:hypothetical protein